MSEPLGLAHTPSTEPLNALSTVVSFSSMDWGGASDTAWIYGIVLGWDGPAMAELAAKFSWSEEKVAHLRKLRRNYRALQLKEERRSAAIRE